MNPSVEVSTTLANPLLPAQQSLTDEELDFQVKIAEKECLGARATYSLKQTVVEDVLIVDPLLKAVHSGFNATATERYLMGGLSDGGISL